MYIYIYIIYDINRYIYRYIYTERERGRNLTCVPVRVRVERERCFYSTVDTRIPHRENTMSCWERRENMGKSEATWEAAAGGNSRGRRGRLSEGWPCYVLFGVAGAVGTFPSLRPHGPHPQSTGPYSKCPRCGLEFHVCLGGGDSNGDSTDGQNPRAGAALKRAPGEPQVPGKASHLPGMEPRP